MRIGVAKERMRDEYRVGLEPGHVEELVAAGHRVRVEAGAGAQAGHADAMYAAAGAEVCGAEAAYDADLVVKVKCPLPEEYPLLKAGQTLFTYLHFDGNAPVEDIAAIVATGVTGIAYEWVEEDGRYPLLEPMSRITGVLFARRALDLLLKGRKHVGGAYGLGLEPARAMVVGVGTIGSRAAGVLARNGLDLTLVDKHPDTLDERMRAIWPGWTPDCAPRRIAFDERDPDPAVRALRAELPGTDILIGSAVRRPTLPPERCRFLVDRAALGTMKPGSVLCDATANIRDFFETAMPVLGMDETYVECGVTHYNCEHIPSSAAHSSTRLLTQATFPYVRRLAGGVAAALRASRALRRGTMCRAGRLTDPLTARNKAMACTPIEETL